MSSKKDKLLESAQKFIAKGQLERAIRDYEQVVALDSGDIRHRQKLADLLVRANRKEEAIREYESIGKHYSDHAFYLKAIAVHKQIQKLDPGNVKVTLSLASLNEKQGLIGNALAEYNNALSYYQKTRQLPEAITVLEQMSAVDPGNLNTLLKFAETYYSAGVLEKSYDQFTRLALLLAKSDESAFKQICNRVASLFPDRKDFLLELVTTLVEEGSVNAAMPHLLAMTGNDNGNRRAWELLAEAYLQQDDRELHTETLQRMVALFPDESSFREKLGQHAPAAGPGEPAEAVSFTPVAATPEESRRSETSRLEALPSADELPVVAEPGDSGYEEPWEEIDISLADEEGGFGPAPDADQFPVGSGEESAVEESERPAIEKAKPVTEGSAHGAVPLSPDFQAIDLAMDEGADESVVPNLPDAYADESTLPGDFSELDLEVDVDEDVDSGVPEVQDSFVDESPLSGRSSDIDLEIDAEAVEETLAPEPQGPGDFSEIDPEVTFGEEADRVPDLQDTDESPPGEFSEIDLEIAEEVEESDAPESQGPYLEELPFPGEFSEIDPGVFVAEDAAETSAQERPGESVDESILPPGEFSTIDLAEIDESPSLWLDDQVGEAGVDEQGFSGLAGSESESTTEMPDADTGMPVGEDSPAVEAMFDLGGELRQEGLGILDDDPADSEPSCKYSPDGLFSAFKVVVDQQLDQEDTETHYNLGIAYKEMGLYDDAIAEFRAASRSAARAADCLTLQGICHRDKGDVKSAEEAFEKGLALEGLSAEEALSLKYELALLLEGAGRSDEALSLYREVRALNAGFREIGSRIAAITGDEEVAASEELELLELDVEELD